MTYYSHVHALHRLPPAIPLVLTGAFFNGLPDKVTAVKIVVLTLAFTHELLWASSMEPVVFKERTRCAQINSQATGS